MVYTAPKPLTSMDQRATVGVSQDGFLEFGPCGSPCPFIRTFLDVLSSDMQWAYVPKPSLASAAESDEAIAQTEDGISLVPANADADDLCKNIFDGDQQLITLDHSLCLYWQPWL